MIQNVRSGQALTAGLLNNIISQANGQDIPSNQNFVNTDKGTLFVNNHDYEVGGLEGSFNKFLECWIDNAPEISNRPNEYAKDANGNLIMKPYILVNLGDSEETACKNITVNNKPVDGIVLISNNESLDVVVTDEILENNYFVQLAKIDSSSENIYDVHFILYKAIKVSDNEDEPPEILGYIFVISKEDIESAKERAKSKITEIEGFDGVTHLQVLNDKKILATTKIGNKNVISQNVICSQDLIDENSLSSDTDVSDEGGKLNQYSVEIKSTIIEKEDENGESIPTEVKYTQLYDFNDAEIKKELDKQELKKYSLLIRFNEGAGDSESSDGESSDGESSEDKLKELQYLQYIYYSSDTEETASDGSGSEGSGKVVSKSVELMDKEGESEGEESYIKYYQLYNFTSDSDKSEITLSVNNDEENNESSEDGDYDFLIRKKSDAGYELAYADLKIVGDLSANISNEISTVISSMLSTEISTMISSITNEIITNEIETIISNQVSIVISNEVSSIISTVLCNEISTMISTEVEKQLSVVQNLSVEENTILGYELEYDTSDYAITLKRGRLVIENNVLKLVPDSGLTQKIGTTPISEIIR